MNKLKYKDLKAHRIYYLVNGYGIIQEFYLNHIGNLKLEILCTDPEDLGSEYELYSTFYAASGKSNIYTDCNHGEPSTSSYIIYSTKKEAFEYIKQLNEKFFNELNIKQIDKYIEKELFIPFESLKESILSLFTQEFYDYDSIHNCTNEYGKYSTVSPYSIEYSVKEAIIINIFENDKKVLSYGMGKYNYKKYYNIIKAFRALEHIYVKY